MALVGVFGTVYWENLVLNTTMCISSYSVVTFLDIALNLCRNWPKRAALPHYKNIEEWIISVKVLQI